MVTVCLTCGDEGATNAFVYCVECLDYAVHRYCLHILPKTLDEFVYWYCDDCEVLRPKNVAELQSKPKKKKKKKKRKSLRYVRKHRKRSALRRDNAEVAPTSAKAMSNEDSKWVIECSSLRVKKTACPCSHEFTGHDTPLEDGVETTKKCLLSENIEQSLVVSSFEEPCSKACGSDGCNEPAAFKSELEGKVNPDDHACEGQESSAACEEIQRTQEVLTTNKLISRKRKFDCSLTTDISEQGPKNRLETHESASQNCLSTDLSEQGLGKQPKAHEFDSRHAPDSCMVDNRVFAKPIIDPIWRGHFDIQNMDFDAFGGLVAAHVSHNACQKVYNEANLFPSSLQLEMHPKEDVWPKSFKETGPSDENLALYFFPNEKRYEGIFDDLVLKMSTQELALKATTENAELLLFPSSELPFKFWMFQRKNYLWGVFRDKKAVVSH